MGWTPFQSGIAVVMVVTGSINTLAAKWANYLYSENSIGAEVEFNHPYLQADAMFVGEFLCMGAYYVSLLFSGMRAKDDLVVTKAENDDSEKEDPERKQSRSRSRTYSVDVVNHPELVQFIKKKPFTIKQCYLLLPASLCDMCGTSLMYVALTLTSAASFQMIRGAVIIFTGINSMIFLKAKLKWFQWTGMVVVLCGLIIVGLPDILYPAESTCYLEPNRTDLFTGLNDAKVPNYEFDVYRLEAICPADGAESAVSGEILGDALIVGAQLIVSFQMVYEEKVLSNYDIQPLQAVGWEGFWGFCGMTTALVIFYFIPISDPSWSYDPTPPYVLEDALDGFIQLGNNPLLLIAILGTVFSIAFFNFAGLTVTKELSATTRMVLDSVRTLVIWLFSIIIGWQKFQYLQLIGFVVLLAGMSLYNDLLIMPTIRHYQDKKNLKKLEG